MESKILKVEKKNMKRGKAETESLLRECSSLETKKGATEQPSIVPEKKKRKKKEEEEEETTTTESEGETKKSKKTKKKRGKTEAESGSLLRECSYSERKKGTIETEQQPNIVLEEETTTTTESQAEKKKKGKKKKRSSSRFGSLKPLITTVTTTTTTTTSITIITPPEDPNNYVHLYLCVVTGTDCFTWFKIDPSNTTAEPHHLISSDDNYNNNSFYSATTTLKKIFPISQMPPLPYGFHIIPHSSPPKQKQKKKLVYAVGGSICLGRRSSKALVCDFASSPSSLIWEELPPLPSETEIRIGVASPLDGNLYAFGCICSKDPHHPYTNMGLVYNPSSTSWNQCPHPFSGKRMPEDVDDYALIDTEDRTELSVFTYSKYRHRFNLSTAQWEWTHYALLPKDPFCARYVTSSSVGVGHLIFKFHDFKLYVLDASSSSPEPSFEPVLGLENEFKICRGNPFIAYLGKGKLCIVWDTIPAENAAAAPQQILHIHCLKFWVGMCNRMNRLRAVFDRCESFSVHGGKLYSVVTL